MIKELVHDEAILSVPCEKATAEDAQIADDLVETLLANDEALCLAANQIGETKQIAAIVINDHEGEEGIDPEVMVMFNPILKKGLYPQKVEEECLSLDEPHKATRFARITVAYDQLVDGELVARKQEFILDGAQAIQHMIDHCKGKLI